MPVRYVRTPRAVPTLLLLASLVLGGCGLGMDHAERLARAERALADGDTRTAIIDSKNVLLDEPGNAAARLVLGRASLAEGDGGTAEKELRRAVELGVAADEVTAEIARAMLLQGKARALVDEFAPGDDTAAATPDLQQVLGEAYLALGQPEAARGQFQAVLAAEPANAAAQLGVAMSYLSEGNVAQARASISQVLELSPEHVPAWLFSGRLNLASGASAQAVSDFERARTLAAAAKDSGAQAEALFGLAEAAFATGDLETARGHAASLEAVAPGSLVAMQTHARVAIGDENWTRAQELLTEILRRAPRNNFARTMLGAVHLQTGNLGQAEMYLSTAVNDQPGNADARRLLAEARLRLNKAEAAEEALQPMLESEYADARSLAMAARVSFLSGDFDSAANYLERSARDNPGTSDTQLDLAVAYLMAGRLDEARAQLDAVPVDGDEQREFRRDALQALTAARAGDGSDAVAASAKLVDAWPDEPLARVLHGAFLSAEGQTVAAENAFDRALELDPRNTTALRYRARLAAQAGDTAAASRSLRRLLEVNGDDVAAMLALGTLAARAENADEARSWFERAHEADPDAVAPRLLLARYHLATGNLDRAATLSEEALTLSADAADAHNTLGMVHLSRGEGEQAVARFETAVRLDPGNRDYSLNLARAYAAGGEIERARELLATDSDEDLRHLPSAAMLVTAQARSGDVAAAFATVRRLRQLHAGSVIPVALEAELHAMNGDLRQAVRVYDEAIGIDLTRQVAARAYFLRGQAGAANAAEPLERYLATTPRDGEIRLLLAQHRHQENDTAQAAAEYARVIEVLPENFVALNNLAWLYFVEGDERAESIARRAHALAPENGSVADTLGWILVKKGSLAEGIDLLRDAVARADRPEVRYHLAAALAESGDTAAARQMLEQVLAANAEFPGRDEAQALLASL